MPVNILFYAPNHIGDTIMAVATVKAYTKKYPEHHIYIACNGLVQKVWESFLPVDQIILVKKTFKEQLHFVQNVKQLKIQTCFIFAGSTRSALLCFLAKVPNRIGYLEDKKRFFLTEGIKIPSNPSFHKSIDYYYLVFKEIPSQTLRPQLTCPSPKVEWNWGSKVYLNKKLVSFLPGAARGPSKRWPTEYFSQLANELLSNRDDIVIHILGTDEDTPLAKEIMESNQKHLPRSLINLCGKTSLTEWQYLISKSQLVICNDSGGMHLADAMEVPLIALFGATDTKKTGPLGENSLPIQHSKVSSEKISKSSTEGISSLKAISVSEVLERSIDLLEKNAK